MNMFLAALLFILGIVLVIKGGDWFVDASSFIARAANIPSFIVGATIVSFATTMPELLVSVMASLEGKNDMAVGNAVGSVTANTGLIMGLAIVFMTIVTPRVSYLKQCIILVVAGVILYIGSLSGTLAPWAGTVLIIVFIIFMVINVFSAKSQKNADEKLIVTKNDIIKNIVLFVVGAAGIVLGSNFLIDGGSAIATALGVPERVIAVTMVAIGTSLPELVTTITAIRKKESNLSVGNIIGANIIDLSLILPICTFVSSGTFAVSRQCLNIDLPASIIICLIAVLPMIIKEKAYKAQGIIMLLAYAVYLFITI